MLPRNHSDRIRIVFDDHRLVANADLLLPATLAQHLGLGELVDHHLDLGSAPGRANTGDKMMTLVASALAGGDCIDDADALRTGGTACTLRRHGKSAIHPGDLPAQLPVGPRPPAGPGEPGTAGAGMAGRGRIRRRAVHHRPRFHHLRDLRAGQEGRATPWLHRQTRLSPAAGRGRRQGQLAVRADSGFYAHAIVAICRKMKLSATPSPSANTKACAVSSRRYPRRIGRPYPTGWTVPPMWRKPPTSPFESEPDAAPVRLIVRRVKPTLGSQLALFASYSYHGFITDRDGETLALEADHRRHAEIGNTIRDLKYGTGLNHLPSGRFTANAAWLAVQVMAHNLARWTARIGLGEQVVTIKTLQRRFFALAGRLTRSARRLTLHLPKHWPWEAQFSRALARLRAVPLPA